jgi:hypothetical protein
MVRSLGLAAAIVVAFLNGAALSEGAVACEAPEFAFRGELRGLLPGPYGPATTAGTSWRVSLVADIDGDGLADLVRLDESGILFSRNEGRGSFAAPLLVGPPADSLAIGDFDGDGHADLVFTRDESVRLFVGDGTGAFRDAGRFCFWGAGAFDHVVAGDFDGDGRLDVAWIWHVSPGNTGRLVVAFGDGRGAFPRVTKWEPPEPPEGQYGFPLDRVFEVHAFDFDGDGRTDLVAGSWVGTLTSSTRVLVAHGDGSFELGPGLGGGFYSASVVVPVELNGDGVMDLVSLESFKIYSWTVYPFIRLPAGGWTEPSLATCSHAEYATLAFGDLTGDGKADLAYVSGGTVNIDRETASGRFERLVSFPTSTSRRDVVIFDVDGDGKQDLVLGPTKTEPAQWWAACPPSKTRQPVAPGPVLHPARRTRTTP